MQSLIIAFAMYSRIPMPRADWNDKNMRYAFCWFPVIGLVIGLVTGAVFYILTEWQGGICFPWGLPDGGALMDYRRDSFGWIYGYNRCQKFLWGQGKETDDPERFPCGSFCGYRLWCIHDVISGGME